MKTINLPVFPLRRKSKDAPVSPETASSDLICAAKTEDQSEKPLNSPADDKPKHKMKNLNKLKALGLRIRNRSKSSTTSSDSEQDVSVVLDFNQNLEQNNLAEADLQLLEREEHLFSFESSDEQVLRTEDEEDSLQKDYETLKLHLQMIVNDSFNNEKQGALKSAVTAILQEEERDRYWREAAVKECPHWRPMNCREIHDLLLQRVVELRIQRANEEENGADDLSTSLKKDVCRMGKRVQNDLLRVVRDVRDCYTPEFDVCNMYAQLYHQAFSTKLLELARSHLELEDCIYILSWINIYYSKDVLQQKELESYINTEALGPLLPEEELKSLEEQYLSHKEFKVKVWLSNALKKEEELWQTDQKPEQIDGYFLSSLALDVIQLVEGAMKEVVAILGNSDKALRILFQLSDFLKSYKKSIAELIKGKNSNISDQLKANLVSIKHFKDYIEEKQNLPDEVKTAWLSTFAHLKDSCHKYFLTLIHKELKKHYRMLWTPAWFAGSHGIIGDLIIVLEYEIKHFSDLKPVCMEELLSQLHVEVMTEYVRRMLKRKLKLKDRSMQETAAGFLCEDSIRINTLFIKNGSKEKWLPNVLPKISEVVRLQDAGALQLEIVTLARAYPDIKERHIHALLQLKTNLLNTDVQQIKSSLCENRGPENSEPLTPFFCNVYMKKNLI